LNLGNLVRWQSVNQLAKHPMPPGQRLEGFLRRGKRMQPLEDLVSGRFVQQRLKELGDSLAPAFSTAWE
jgi:hypothetical protein